MRFNLFALLVVLLLAVTMAQARVSFFLCEEKKRQGCARGVRLRALAYHRRPSQSLSALLSSPQQSLAGKKDHADGEAGEAIVVREMKRARK